MLLYMTREHGTKFEAIAYHASTATRYGITVINVLVDGTRHSDPTEREISFGAQEERDAYLTSQEDLFVGGINGFSVENKSY